MDCTPNIARARVSHGYRRIHLLLQREGWKVNHKIEYTGSTDNRVLLCVSGDTGDMFRHIGKSKYFQLKVPMKYGQWTS